jgi:arginine/lysine/ornithine decarboxylase
MTLDASAKILPPDRQLAAPLLEKLQNSAQQSRAAFHTPGHKKGQGMAAQLRGWLGTEVFRADLPELPELDNLFAPVGVIQQAQALAAEAFGAEQTWFLCNGSTCGIEAAVLATCQPGEKLILPRNAHQSSIAALILSGAVPVFVEPTYDSTWDIAYCVTPASIQLALAQHPDAKAVLIVSPTYQGVCADIESIAQITHQSAIPLLVDEAHGAHFAFHPDLPLPALKAGADLVVQSIHKTLSALTQAAMLHGQATRVDRDRLSRALQLVQSTSPNYLLLASLDAARRQMATEGHALMTRTLELADRAKTQVSQIPGLRVLQWQPDLMPGCWAIDPTRLTVDVTGLGLTGFAADEILHQTLGVTAELPALRHLTFMITLGNTVEDIDRLVDALRTLAKTHGEPSPSPPLSRSPFFSPSSPLPPLSRSPRQAFFAPTVTVPIEAAIDRVSAELVCPYPPGIPVLFPGEVITLETLRYLQQIAAAGGTIAGCADSSLRTLKVVNP